ncbi:3-hydroxyacyl-CoA dehydrogenase NAD-binding domain-containing protein [Amycolatopsis sp. NPDC051758]
MKATIVGGGVIGVSWAGLTAAHGLDVVVSDPAPGVEDTAQIAVLKALGR